LKFFSPKYHFLHTSLLIFIIGCLQYFLSSTTFSFSSFNQNYAIAFWKIYLSTAICSFLNFILYLVCFHFNKIKSMVLYQIHVGVFLISTIIFLGSIFFISNSHFFKKYYSYNEFYKLQVVDIFNISICVALLLIPNSAIGIII
jgi:hypothetical protein